MNILHLDSAITSDASVSRKLTADIVARLTAADSAAQVTYRDLNEGVPAIDTTWFRAVRVGTDNPTPEEEDRVETSDKLLAEVQDADTLVIGLPVYNFSIPAQLKNWLDQIAREKQETRKADVRARGKSRLQVQRGRRREAPKPTDVLQRLASSAPDLVEASPCPRHVEQSSAN